MRILPVITLVLVTGAQAARAQSPSAPASLQQWFATPVEKRGAPPGDRVLSKAEATGMVAKLMAARRMGERLDELKKDDPGGYDFLVNVQPGRGHGIDYAEGPKWIAQRTRNPLPQRVVWTVRPFDKTVALQRYWLALPEAPQVMPLHLAATLSGNAIAITAETSAAEGKGRTPAAGGSLLVRLSDAMLDLDQPVTISVNGKAIAPAKAGRRLAVMARTMAERCDPHYTFPAEITVPLAP